MLQDVSLAQSLGIFFSLVSIESKDHKSFGSTFSAASLDCMYVGIAQGRQAPIINKIKIFTIVEETVYVRTRICRPIQHQHAIPAHLTYTYIDCACIILFEKKKGILIDPEVEPTKSIFLAKFSTTSNYSYTSHDLHGQQRSGPQPELFVWVACMRSVKCHLYDGPETRSQVLLDELLSRQTTTTTY